MEGPFDYFGGGIFDMFRDNRDNDKFMIGGWLENEWGLLTVIT